jgi:hypothetical protein
MEGRLTGGGSLYTTVTREKEVVTDVAWEKYVKVML